MPKRSDREVFSKYFSGNPFEGMQPVDIYKKLKWGNNPKEIIDIYAPEPLVSLGYAAKIFLSGNHTISFRDDSMHLAVGANSNNVYIFHYKINTIPYFSSRWRPIALALQTDYNSDKGGEDCYYYHHHEAPYPILYKFPKKHIYLLVPQSFNGRRSYAVIKEGIVG